MLDNLPANVLCLIKDGDLELIEVYCLVMCLTIDVCCLYSDEFYLPARVYCFLNVYYFFMKVVWDFLRPEVEVVEAYLS